jgi:hypothetical protein
MAKQDFTMYIYKQDKRTKSGERPVSTTVWRNRDEAEMKREVRELQYELWPVSKGYRIEFVATMMTVKNLITGKDVLIEANTPWFCNPASETYWSM